MPWQPLPREHQERADPRPLGSSLDRLAARLGAPRPDVLGTVFGHWAEVVGAELSAHAQPLTLRDRTLVVGVDQPAWATQLEFLKPQLIARLGEATGSHDIEDVRIRVVRP